MGCWWADLGEEEVSVTVTVILCWASDCRMLTSCASSGKVPSQSDWEEMFSDGRIGWDEKGVRQNLLGC